MKIKERPILFNAEMVRAIRSGRKTQTRRQFKDYQVPKFNEDYGEYVDTKYSAIAQKHSRYGFCAFGETELDCIDELIGYGCGPYGRDGDQLYTRENWADVSNLGFDLDLFPNGIAYKADCRGLESLDTAKGYGVKWKPSIHMFRKDSRDQLEITNVRVERLNDISVEDAKSEGIRETIAGNEQFLFETLWNSIYKNWDENPWVWVYEFKVVKS